MARAAAIALVASFVVSRIVLLASSYDTNQNGEEPVFLFSATELARDGFAGLFDHQDDLNHGASVLFLVLAVPWIKLLGTSLLTLKGLAIAWSALTLCVMIAVAWRYFSPRTGLLLGLFYLTLSPTIARLNVTLVGSHPEALLPCFLALGAFLAWARRTERGEVGTARMALGLGFGSGFALWMSYLSATIVAPLLAVPILYKRNVKILLALAVGLVTGVSPWVYQNLWLRPHGALLWMEHVGVDYEALGLGSPPLLQDLVASFGFREPVGVLMVALCLAAVVVLAVALRHASWRHWLGLGSLTIVPLIVAPAVGLGLLAWAERPSYPNEGYYHYRYFFLLQGALFLPLAIVTDRCLMVARRPIAIALTLLVLTGVVAQAGLYNEGNGYEENLEHDRLRGCLVFGLAEWKRAPSQKEALDRLGNLSDPRCAERALGGLGWMMVREAIVRRDPEEIARLLAMVETQDHRRAICGGARFWLKVTKGRVAGDAREQAVRQVEQACAGATAQ